MAESDQKPTGYSTTSRNSTTSEWRIGPRSLHEFVGQSELVKRVGGMSDACRIKGTTFPHALLVGPPGIGRTTLAHIIARELGVTLHWANAENIERAADLATTLNGLEEGDVLLLQDFERLRRPVAQRLESAMRDFEFHIVVGEGSAARTIVQHEREDSAAPGGSCAAI